MQNDNIGTGKQDGDQTIGIRPLGFEVQSQSLSFFPSKTKEGKVYWKFSLQVVGVEKPFEKFGKLFDSEEAAKSDFEQLQPQTMADLADRVRKHLEKANEEVNSATKN